MAGISDEAIASLTEVVGDAAMALSLLQATDGNVDAAAALFLAADGNAGAGTAAGPRPPPPEADDAPAVGQEEEPVRAPLPTITDRLYGEGFVPPARPRRADTRPTEAAAFGGGGGSGDGGGAHPPLLPPAGGVHGGGEPAPSLPALAGLFEPPHDLITPGDIGDALGAAAAAGTWLLFNVQANSEFDSHRLNRDVWADGGVRALLGSGAFTFWQACASAEAGGAALARYGLDRGRLPAIAIADPSTGALAAVWHGYVGPERLGEELVPFLDTPPSDPGAGRLIARCRRRGLHPGGKPAAVLVAEAAAAAPAPAAEGTGGDGGAGGGPPVPLPGAAAGAAAPAPALAPAPPPPPPGPDPAAVAAAQAAAAAALPPEPPAGAPGAVRVAARLTGGGRATRTFPGTAPAHVLRDWIVSADGAAAAAGRESFTLRFPAGPGGGGVAVPDWGAALSTLGLAGALLTVAPLT